MALVETLGYFPNVNHVKLVSIPVIIEEWEQFRKLKARENPGLDC